MSDCLCCSKIVHLPNFNYVLLDKDDHVMNVLTWWDMIALNMICIRDHVHFVQDVLSDAKKSDYADHVYKGQLNWSGNHDCRFAYYKAPICSFFMEEDRPCPSFVLLKDPDYNKHLFGKSNTLRFDGLHHTFSTGNLAESERLYREFFRDVMEQSGVLFSEIIFFNAVVENQIGDQSFFGTELQKNIMATYVVARPSVPFSNSSVYADTIDVCEMLIHLFDTGLKNHADNYTSGVRVYFATCMVEDKSGEGGYFRPGDRMFGVDHIRAWAGVRDSVWEERYGDILPSPYNSMNFRYQELLTAIYKDTYGDKHLPALNFSNTDIFWRSELILGTESPSGAKVFEGPTRASFMAFLKKRRRDAEVGRPRANPATPSPDGDQINEIRRSCEE